MINGRVRDAGDESCIINIDAPCDFKEKLRLWDRILLVAGQRERLNTCIIDNFSAILEEGEMMGSGGLSSSREMREFASFVEQGKLLDMKL